jgi:hypothetical protein
MTGREFDFHGENFDLGENHWVLFIDEDGL